MRIVQKGGQMQASMEIRQGDAPDPVSTGAPCELHDPVFGTPDRRTGGAAPGHCRIRNEMTTAAGIPCSKGSRRPFSSRGRTRTYDTLINSQVL
jgi:hypothetical protein